MARKVDDRPAPPIVRYAPLGDLKVYVISEAELERLADGPPGQLQLNFALALLPTAMSIGVTLATTTMTPTTSNSFQVAFWLMLIQGLYSLIRWFCRIALKAASSPKSARECLINHRKRSRFFRQWQRLADLNQHPKPRMMLIG